MGRYGDLELDEAYREGACDVATAMELDGSVDRIRSALDGVVRKVETSESLSANERALLYKAIDHLDEAAGNVRSVVRRLEDSIRKGVS